MRFSQSTHLLCLSLATLTAIIRIGSPILVGLIDLVNSVIISNHLTWMVNFPSQMPDWLSQSCSFGFIYFFWCWYLFDNCFFLIEKFWSCCYLSFYWLSIIFTTGCPVTSHCLWLILIWLGWSSWSLNSVLLLLLVNFVSGFRLEMMYISLITSIRSSLTHLLGSQLLVLLP